jgi:hypothetical protein
MNRAKRKGRNGAEIAAAATGSGEGREGVGLTRASPFLTIAEAAELARVSPKRIRNLMAAGVLQEGVHFTRPRGLGARFRREALIAWIDGRDAAPPAQPPARRARCNVDLSLIPRVQVADGV